MLVRLREDAGILGGGAAEGTRLGGQEDQRQPLLGRVREARAICAVARRLVPDHACWAIGEYLCRMSEGKRESALDWLEAEGLTRDRAWEQAADLLIAETGARPDASRRARVISKIAARPGGGDVLAALGIAPNTTEVAS